MQRLYEVCAYVHGIVWCTRSARFHICVIAAECRSCTFEQHAFERAR
jgi:hypothetical protein